MIDRDYKSYDTTLAILGRLKASSYNVIGNHDWSVDNKFKGEVRNRLNNKRGYFDFKFDNIVFIILDGSDVSTFAHLKDSKQYNSALAKSEKMKRTGLNNYYTWNGAIGHKQFRWLATVLRKADDANKKVVIFCHWPLLPEIGTQLWNNKKMIDLINSHDCVIAWIAGHHHPGDYLKKGNIHYLTIKGLVEAQSETSCGIIEVYPDKLLLKGYGDQDDRVLEISR